GLSLLELERELAGDVAVPRLQVRLDLRLELPLVRLAERDLAGDALHEAAIELEPLPPFLEPLGGLIHLELHHGDRIRLEEEIRDLAELSANGAEQLSEDHGFFFAGDVEVGVSARGTGSVSPASIASARILPR